MSVSIHQFYTSADAYDACQCDEKVKDGDVLVIECEEVVGVAETWPIAVTKAYGDLHRLGDGVTLEQWADGANKSILLEGWKAACELAEKMGYALARE